MRRAGEEEPGRGGNEGQPPEKRLKAEGREEQKKGSDNRDVRRSQQKRAEGLDNEAEGEAELSKTN